MVELGGRGKCEISRTDIENTDGRGIVFYSKVSTKPAGPDTLSARARDAGAAAAQAAQAAAQTAAQSAQAAAQTAALTAQAAAQTAAQGMGKSARQGVYVARGWAAPRLENAADYTTTTVAPRVADALRSTARQVSPEDVSNRRSAMRSVLSISVLAGAALAAVGAVAILVRHQYKSAMDADTEDDVVDVEDTHEPATERGVSAPGQPAAPAEASTPNGAAPKTDTETGTGATGKASKSGGQASKSGW
jgi:hypothetical protein